jgi:hypothetical protein
MHVPQTTFLPKLLMCGSLAAMALLGGAPARAQLTKRCTGTGYVGADSSNPFTAEYVTTGTMLTPGEEPKISVMKEAVARDSKGRVRIERHGFEQPPDDRKTVTLEKPDGQQFTVTREEYDTLIMIFDCGSGKTVTIRPGMQMATVKEEESVTAEKRVKRAYSTLYIFDPGVRTPPNMTFERMEPREMQGVAAIGMKTTTMGTEKDGEWNGKVIREYEIWLSDELAAQILRIDKDLRAGKEGRWELLGIKREEPDPALFEIPKGYDVNPARLPSSRDWGVVRPSKE